MTEEAAKQNAAPRKGLAKKLAIPAGLVLVAAIGAGAFFLAQRGAAGEAPAQHAEPAPTGLVSVEPFVVNLADVDASRFARVTVRLIVQGETDAEAIAHDTLVQARLRSAILELIAQQTSASIVTVEGKSQLKKAIAERGTHVLGQRVHDVLFTDFVVQ